MFTRSTLQHLGISLLMALALAAAGAAAQTQSEMTRAEVKKVDKGTQKITLKHEAIKNLDMPPMTMVFKVQDPELLDKAKPGDKVKVSIERRDGAMVVMTIEADK